MTTTAPNPNPPALAPASSEPATIAALLNHKDTLAKFSEVIAGKITPEKMLRMCVNAIRKTPKLMECDPYSVFGAMLTSASLGLEPNTVLQQAFLIPYAKKVKQLDARGKPVKNERGYEVWDTIYECQFQIGYKGFVALIHRDGGVVDLQAEAVRENDFFDHLKGTETFLKYRKKLSERGALVGAWCMIKTNRADIGQAIGVLELDEIHKVRERSETYRHLRKSLDAAKAALDVTPNDAKALKEFAYQETRFKETPWVMWEDDMAVKTVLKKAVKLFPLSPEVTIAIELDDAAERGALNLRALSKLETLRDVKDGMDAPLIEHKPEEPINTAAPENIVETRPPAKEVVQPMAKPGANPAAKATEAAKPKPEETPQAEETQTADTSNPTDFDFKE